MKTAKVIAICGLALLAGSASFASDLRFSAGFGSRNQTPVVLLGGVSYKDAALKVQGMGLQQGSNDFWMGLRGSLLWTFFRELPFNFEAGLGGGYEYARTPNKMHQAINKANGKIILLPYNFKENLDVSLELWTHLYGFYTQLSAPIYRFKEHDAQNLLWGAGYLLEF